MLGKTKNFLFSLCKRKTILFVFFFSFFGLTFARSASAGWVTDLALNVATWPLFQTARILIDLAIFLAGLSGSILNWVLGPNFISYSYTNPGGPKANPIIEAGLGVTQGFVNMLLVLILVYIAIATILRLAGYQTEKLLMTFFIVALLVNFAPVICGVIVDASNIIMNFFVQDLEGDAFGNAMGRRVSDIMSGYKETGTYTEARPYMMQIIVLMPFLLGLTFILLLFSSVFAFRYIAIWLLVILSPLAFACYILPVTRKYFDMWWKQFINWSFIGVTCGFFLYLGLLLVTKIQDGTAVGVPVTGQQAPFNSILPFFVSLAFLGIGLVFGLQSSAIGASTVISLTRRSQRWAGRRGRWVAKEGAKKIGRGIRPIVEGRARKLAAGAYSTMIKIGNWSPTGGEFKPGALFKWAAPKRLKDFGNLRPVINEGMKEADGQSGKAIGDQIANEKVQGPKATGWYSQLLKQNDSQDLFRAFKRKLGKGAEGKKWKDMSDEEIANDANFHRIMAPILVHAKNSGKLGSTLRRDPRLAEVAYEKDIGNYGKSDRDMTSPQDAINKAVAEAREHLKDWEPESLKSQKVTGGVMAHLDRDRQLQVNRQIKRGQPTQLKTMDQMFSDFTRMKSSLSGLTDTEIEAKLKVRIDADGNEIESDDFKKVWKEFDKHIEKTFGDRKYFVSVEEKRMQTTGWRKMKFIPKESSGPSSTLTPGATMEMVKEVEKLRSIGEKARQTQPLKSISEKRKEEQKLKSIKEKRKAKKEK